MPALLQQRPGERVLRSDAQVEGILSYDDKSAHLRSSYLR